MMLKLNGFEVCQAVKGNVATQGTYVIMLTAKGQDFDQQRGHKMGADLYMTKPLTRMKFWTKLQKCWASIRAF